MDIKKYRVKPNKKVDLEKFSTRKDDSYSKKEVKEEILPQNLEKMFEFQEKLYAENKRGILVVLQAMDAAGKDSLVKKVFTALNPAGCKVTSFKQPSTEELDHDYLWRITQKTPAYGEVGIFNRSHYEDVLVTRVHNLVNQKNDDDFWEKRFEDINAFEKYLDNNGIKVVKFFLHVSNKNKDFWTGLTWTKNIGSLQQVIFWKEKTGTNITRLTKICWSILRQIMRHGMWFLRTTNGSQGLL